MIDKRPQADRLLIAELYGEARRHAKWRELSGEEEAAAVAGLRKLAGGRADLLAEVVGIFEGAHKGQMDEPLTRQAAALCRKAGADPEAILTDLAVLMAGRRRLALRDEWHAHLAGESGHNPVTWRKIGQALGFLAAAIRYRLADSAELAWRPADAVLGSRTLSNLFVWGPVIVTLFAHHDGRFGLVADVQDPVALGAFLYGVIRTGRWWRGVKPPEPKARRARE